MLLNFGKFLGFREKCEGPGAQVLHFSNLQVPMCLFFKFHMSIQSQQA